MLFRVAVLLSVQSLMTAGCPEVVNRKTWDAVDPVRIKYLERPVSMVVIQHTVTNACSTDESCERILRSIQNYHMDNLNFWDVSASFYVGGNGKVYEGVGWLYVGSHTKGYNSKSIGVSFIGNYNNLAPTDAQLEAVKNLLKCGVEEGHLTSEYHVVGHKQLAATESPGRKLYNAIRKWPEWLEDISSIKN